jgi:ribosomal protein S18 acetylase RimI-like enzyme
MAWRKRIKLTAARMSDLLLLLDMMAECYAAEGLALEWEQAYSSLIEMIANPQQRPVWVLKVGGMAAGYLILQLIPDGKEPGSQAIIDELYVRPQFRSPALSAKVTDFAIRFCRAAGIRAFHQRIGQQWYLMTKWL